MWNIGGKMQYSRAPFIRINWDGQPSSGYAENPDNLILKIE
jgi:hypothetical protein